MHNSFGLQRFSFDDGEDTEKRLKIEGMRDDGRAIVKDDGRFGSRGGLDAEDLLWEYLIGLIAKWCDTQKQGRSLERKKWRVIPDIVGGSSRSMAIEKKNIIEEKWYGRLVRFLCLKM